MCIKYNRKILPSPENYLTIKKCSKAKDLFLVFLSHMNDTAGDPQTRSQPHISRLFRWRLVQLTEEGRNEYIPLRRSRLCRPFSPKSSFDIFVSVFYLCGTTFSSWDVCIPLDFFIFAPDVWWTFSRNLSRGLARETQEAFTLTYSPSGECLEILRSSVDFWKQLNMLSISNIQSQGASVSAEILLFNIFLWIEKKEN